MTKEVKIALIRKNLTLQRIADRLGVSKPLVSMMLDDKYGGFKHRPKIARMLGMPVDDIFPQSKIQNSKSKISEGGFHNGK